VWLSLHPCAILASVLQALGNASSMSGCGLLSVCYCVMLTRVPPRRPNFLPIFFNHVTCLTKISRLACLLLKEEAWGLWRGT
jgi:hypothetical protein